MLVVHSSSRCDVCLSEYSWDTSGKRPHAIACGHIFCRDCLYANTPPLCPLCRHIYQPNKMKRLHVDKPEDIDDHKEVDLLQRLVISWDTPPEQLKEVVNEVDLWLGNRSEEACVALRKARDALGRTLHLKNKEMRLLNTVHSLEDEIQQWDASMTREQEKSRASRESFTAQIDSMTKEIYDLRGQVERFQTQYYSKYSGKNPLPAPPRPLLTPNLPSFDQALSESGSGVRIMELPSSSMSPFPRFEVETHKKPKRKSNLAEQHYSAYDYDDLGYQQGSSIQAIPAREVTPSHYVQAHINVATYDQSPQAHSSHSQPEFESTHPSLDVYTLTHAYLREYSSGFLSGHQAATGSRRKDALRNIYAPRQPTQPATAFEQPVDDYRAPSANIYRDHPYSAPVTREMSPRRTHHRRNTAQSSILSSSSSPVRSGSDSSRSRSRSRGVHTSSASLTQDVQFSNSRLASIMLGTEPGPAEPPLLRQPTPIRSPSPRPQDLDPPPASNRPRSPSSRSSPSAQSRRTWNSGSWGTPAPSHLTDGSVISGLHFFRSTVPRPTSFDGQEITSFPLLNSDGQSVRTRQSISDMGHDESTSQISRSPPRPIDSMVGVIPSDLNPGLYRNAYSESHLLQHSNGWNANEHATRTTRSSGHYDRDEDSAPAQESRNSLNGHPNSHLDRHARSTHEEPGQYRSPAPLDPPIREPAWGDPWGSGQGNGYAVNGSSWSYFNEVQPPPQAERRHVSRAGSDENARRGRPRHSRPAQPLPAESPAAVAADYGYGDSYGTQPHSGHGAASRIVGHAEPEAAAPSSFIGNALGLELAAGPTSINAPTPVVPQTFLRSWSQDH